MIPGLLLWSALLIAQLPEQPEPPQTTPEVEQRLEAVRKAPTDPRARLELGMAYAEAEEYDLAMSELVESIHLNPDNTENLSAEANFHLGMVLTALERTGLAARAYREALRLGLNEAPVHTALGEALAAERQYEEAIVEYRAALNLSPDSFVAHAGMALALEASGKLDDALTEYEAALQLAPSADDHAVAALKQRLMTLKERRQL
jgi:protein O-GlcNAc transferase